MNRDDLDFRIEPERYELVSPPLYRFGMDRRVFFKSLGAGLVVVLSVRSLIARQESGRGQRRGRNALPQELGAWLHIGEDGRATVYTGKVEVGQNARTSLTQVVMEELRISEGAVRMVMGDTDLTPWDIGTFGSLTTPTMAPQLRKVSAAARKLLVQMAAERWQVSSDGLRSEEGRVVDPEGNRSLAYGELTRGQRLMQVIEEGTSTVPAERWKVQGTSLPKIGGRDFVTGQHRYAFDLKRPEIQAGKVLRPPGFGARLVSIDTSPAETLSGVKVVRNGDFVAVSAPDEDKATQALRAIKAEWQTPAQPAAGEIFRYLKENPGGERGFAGNADSRRGSIDAGMAEADHRLSSTYTLAYIAHVPLEPRAAVAEWNDGKLTVWTGSQRPFGVRSELAEAFRLPEEKVRVLIPDTGSGYGGKHTGDAALEAARISRAVGKPVKVVWTRAEEFTWAYFRPAGVIEVSSGVRNDGRITAWEFHNWNSGTAAITHVYDIANQKIEFHPCRSPLRQGSYRGLAAPANHFARESHLDELAAVLKMDPLQFRLANLKDSRLRAVLEAAAERFGWKNPPRSSGRGFGIAGGFEKGSYVATCAEVGIQRPSGSIRLERIVVAFECGAVINPCHLENQIQGALVQGIGGALFEEIDFQDGKIRNGLLSRYRVPRFSDTPAIEIVVLNRKDIPSAGAGETPLVALAPAIGNAVFQSTGTRLRSLPMTRAPLPSD